LRAARRRRRFGNSSNVPDQCSVLLRNLATRQLPSGGWSYFESPQASLEATCLAALVLASATEGGTGSVMRLLLKWQFPDGSWPAFQGDSEGSWTTGLALSTLIAMNGPADSGARSLSWLLEERGKEGHWLWRWKFKTTDHSVRFDPDRFGWPWTSGSASWVIPTVFSVIALKQFTACNRRERAEKRIRLGVGMLLDRVCLGGGWNAGNSVVYGVPLPAHVEATAIALLALQDEERTPVIQASLGWLKQRSSSIESVESLAWCILSLFVYQEPVEHLKARLATLIGDGHDIRNNATLATAILALKCGEMIHPFEVLR